MCNFRLERTKKKRSYPPVEHMTIQKRFSGFMTLHSVVFVASENGIQ